MRIAAFLVTLLFAASVPSTASGQAASTGSGQAWPSKPIRLIVGYPPGGSGDFLTRLAADELSKNLGVPVVTENRPGAGGTIASEVVAKAPPDGYTVLNQWHHGLSKALYKTLPYDGEKDFVPVSRIATGPTIICVGNDLPVKNLRDLIAYAKTNPGKLFVASAGYGSAPHLGAAQFQAAADVKLTMVQFKGGGPAAQSLLAGDTQVMFATPPTVMGFIKAGRMRALAITMPKASPAVPGIPGAEEAGLPGFESTFWFGFYVPAGTPAPIVRRLHEAVFKALSKPDMKERIATQGMEAKPSASPAAFAAEIRAEAPVWDRIVLDSGANVEERR